MPEAPRVSCFAQPPRVLENAPSRQRGTTIAEDERQVKDETPMLLADAMLGRLAKWLRLLGYDTAYASSLPDHRIAARARAEGRIVLTRDRELTKRKGIRSLYIDSQVLEAQIKEVVSALGAPAPDTAARCPRCNAPLSGIPPDEVKTRVPAYVLERHHHFRQCLACDKVYWPGSHWQNVQRIVGPLLKGRDRDNSRSNEQRG